MRTFLGILVLLAAASAARAGDLIPTDSRYGPLRIASHKVDVTVDNQIAITRVEQIFANDYPATFEAHYVFPVPKGASIIDFSMTVNGKLIRGELLEKDRARSIYEGIVRQSKDPGLLEHVGADLFRVRVFPILPNAQQKMEMTYVERVAYDGGTCRHSYPLLVPGGAKTTYADHFEYRWRLTSAVPIKDVTCLTHPADIARRGETSADVTYHGRQVNLSKDLEISYRIERESSGMDLVAHRPTDEDGTFMLLLTPQANAPRLAKDMTFVFDTSGSMEGQRIKQAKAALRFCLSKLQLEDRFNILSFASTVSSFEKAHVAASDEMKARALKFVDALDASGGTNINGALLRALEHRAPEGRPHLIVFLTDGEPTNGETRPEAILRNVAAASGPGVRLFAFGVGAELNRGLLEDLAEASHGVAEFVSDQENIEEKVSRLQKKIAAPVISEIAIDWGQADVSAVYPKSPGDLFAGTQLMIMGRYRKTGTFDLTLKGLAGTQKVEIRQKVTFPERINVAPAVPYLWAMRKIAALLDEIRRNGHNPETVSQIIALSKQYRIATPYTSFLVLESEAAYDQAGIDRKGNGYKPPTPTAQAPSTTPHTVVVTRPPSVVVKVDRRPDVYERKGIPADRGGAGTSEEPAVFFPESKSDHFESSDSEDYHQMKGDSKDFFSYVKGDAGGFRGRQAGHDPGVYDSMGPGAGSGGGGHYGARWGGRENLVAQGGGSKATEAAVRAALQWLAHHQNPDGSWSSEGFDARCSNATCGGRGDRDHDVGVTGLSLLAFLGAGYTPLSKDEVPDPVEAGRTHRFGEVVKKGLQWLLAHQDAEGCVGERGMKYMYGHAIAALALSEAFGMTRVMPLKEPAQAAIDFLVAAQNPGQGWRYSAKGGDSDTSVTGWAVLALKSAELSELHFPKSAYEGAIAWIDSVTAKQGYFQVGYNATIGGRMMVPDKFDEHPTMTGVGAISRILIQKRKNEPALKGVNLLAADLPQWKDTRIDFNYWYFGSLALFQYDGPDGPMWKKWNEPMKNALIPNQKTGKDGCQAGSWEPSSRWANEGGRVWATAINALTLEVYYRYANVFGSPR
jgi:Ca-activated chloride channel family protein